MYLIIDKIRLSKKTGQARVRHKVALKLIAHLMASDDATEDVMPTNLEGEVK